VALVTELLEKVSGKVSPLWRYFTGYFGMWTPCRSEAVVIWGNLARKCLLEGIWANSGAENSFLRVC